MTSKSKNKTATTDSLPALRIGSRVRYRDDGVEGRIVWVNAVSLKIKWDDGEQVTWRRDSLAQRPIDILDHTGVEEQNSMATVTAEDAQSIPTDEVVSTEATLPESEPTLTEETPPISELVPEQTALSVADGTTEVPVPKRRRKPPATPKAKKRSALDAAARVLAEEGKPMNCQELIAVMTVKDYWTSPNGRTPTSTLYSAILRETTTKGTNSRFVKAERGKFALANAM